ncbi:transcriptional regulator AsnC [Legionella micdadei]|uniref:Regulatory protein AsnC n=1 Tax=Legionella micdadei TaxID=451 RepID=A0A098GG61_LEGMI|nr:transcriptional regulator AsnC [Legionella micdadei]ARG97108.1 transcriptional regulator AsnC [Legionella micdadei]ARH00635.1 transcriptional regulator AsnC [Legionella micdadei]KTD29297.1 DNA-binding transcriptional dual regulator [Legionella micdadei]NSL17330.1 transcriptional regulator AsnC [Legionella micdadei]CEG61453.1 Regulatory protein AsnC [Legionella micdadei]
MENYQIDNLDKNILNALIRNARVPYAELAKNFDVSPGTIHVRIEKMKQAGIITGVYAQVDPKQLGYDVCCFIGIILKGAKDYHSVLAKLKSLDEVVEAYYTTGSYSIFIKVMCRSIEALQKVLINKIQAIEEIQSTETLISLENPILRTIIP